MAQELLTTFEAGVTSLRTSIAGTKSEREQKRDPRLSIEERYQSREHYLTLVREAAAPLVKSSYLLADDVPAVLQRAGDHWDLLAKRPAGTTTRAER